MAEQSLQKAQLKKAALPVQTSRAGGGDGGGGY